MRWVIVAFALVLTAGCASAPTPQNAAEYRDAMKQGGFGTKIETLKVERPYADVSATLAAKVDECLQVTMLKSTCYQKGNCAEREETYTPTVFKGADKTEIHVQWKRTPWDSIFLGGPPPEDGTYIAVMDVMPSEGGVTNVTLYTASIEHLQTVPNALKSWAKGTNLGCPDLSRSYYY